MKFEAFAKQLNFKQEQDIQNAKGKGILAFNHGVGKHLWNHAEVKSALAKVQ